MDSPAPKESWLKRQMPRSLFGRALLIIMVPIALMQIIVAYIFFDAHWQTVTASLSDGVAADISVAVQLYEQAPSKERSERLDGMLRPNMRLSMALDEGKGLPTTTRDAFFSTLDKTVRRASKTNSGLIRPVIPITSIFGSPWTRGSCGLLCPANACSRRRGISFYFG